MTDPLPCSPAREHLLQLTLKGKRTERRKLPCAFLKDKQIQTKLAQSAAGTSLSWENGPLHILAVNPTSEIWRLGSFIPCSDWRGWGERESEGHIPCPMAKPSPVNWVHIRDKIPNPSPNLGFLFCFFSLSF